MAYATQVEIAERKFGLFYGANALRLLEKMSGHSVPTIGLMLVTGRGGVGLLLEVIWAGVEGYRIKMKLSASMALTIEEIAEIVDEHPGGVEALFEEGTDFAEKLLEAWKSAFPKRERTDLPKGDPVDPPPAAELPLQEPTTGGKT